MRPVPLGLSCAAVALVSLALAAAVATGGKPAVGSATVGVSYGALTSQGYALWIRLRPDRQRIASLEVSWEAPAARCSNRKTFYDASYLGGENSHVIPVTAGAFSKRAVERYFDGSTAIVENFRVQGRIDDLQAVGQFTVKLTAKRRDGTSYTCNVGPVPFTARN
jgi:hypothetical protein